MMEQRSKIALYVRRAFGDKMNASFDFLRENWKPVLKYVTYFILPVCLFQAIGLNGMIKYSATASVYQAANAEVLSEILGPAEVMAARLILYYLFTVLCYVVGSVLLYSLVYTLMQVYNEREERLQGVTYNLLKDPLKRNFKRMLGVMGVYLGVSLLLIGAAGVLLLLSPLTLLFSVAAVIAVLVPLGLLAPMYIFEKIPMGEALRNTYRIGFATWGGVFLIGLLMGIIGSIVQGAASVPWYVAVIVRYVLAVNDTVPEGMSDPGFYSLAYDFMLYLFSVLQVYGSYVAMIFVMIGMAYQYGHATEKMEGVSVVDDIENFEKL